MAEREESIDAIAAEFEAAWKNGRPVLEDFLSMAPRNGRAEALRRLLRIEILRRRALGENPVVGDYLDRFPDIAPKVVNHSGPHPSPDAETRPDTELGSHAALSGSTTVTLPNGQPTLSDEIRLIGPMGKGGMGEVFHGWHEIIKCDVAVKFSRDSSMDERFRNEIEIHHGLGGHPNIVSAKTAGLNDGRLYLVMEYIAGEDLKQVVERDGPMRPEEAVPIIQKVAEGLAHAHGKSTIHRDIKPSNILLSRDQQVKIIDWGLALDTSLDGPRSRRRLTEPGSLLGTADFIAPEQILDPSEVGPPADLYSLGCCFHYLLTGLPPYHAQTGLRQKIAAHLNSPVPALPDNLLAPPAVQAIIRKLMAKRPMHRFASANDLALALATCLADVEDPSADLPIQIDSSAYDRGEEIIQSAQDLASRAPDLVRAFLAQTLTVGREWFTNRFHQRNRIIIVALACVGLLVLPLLLMKARKPSEHQATHRTAPATQADSAITSLTAAESSIPASPATTNEPAAPAFAAPTVSLAPHAQTPSMPVAKPTQPTGGNSEKIPLPESSPPAPVRPSDPGAVVYLLTTTQGYRTGFFTESGIFLAPLESLNDAYLSQLNVIRPAPVEFPKGQGLHGITRPAARGSRPDPMGIDPSGRSAALLLYTDEAAGTACLLNVAPPNSGASGLKVSQSPAGVGDHVSVRVAPRVRAAHLAPDPAIKAEVVAIDGQGGMRLKASTPLNQDDIGSPILDRDLKVVALLTDPGDGQRPSEAHPITPLMLNAADRFESREVDEQASLRLDRELLLRDLHEMGLVYSAYAEEFQAFRSLSGTIDLSPLSQDQIVDRWADQVAVFQDLAVHRAVIENLQRADPRAPEVSDFNQLLDLCCAALRTLPASADRTANSARYLPFGPDNASRISKVSAALAARLDLELPPPPPATEPTVALSRFRRETRSLDDNRSRLRIRFEIQNLGTSPVGGLHYSIGFVGNQPDVMLSATPLQPVKPPVLEAGATVSVDQFVPVGNSILSSTSGIRIFIADRNRFHIVSAPAEKSP